MNPDAILAIEKIIEFCHEKWAEADKAPPAEWPTKDMWVGKKMAYNPGGIGKRHTDKGIISR
jgi:hypothetical protein